ncbi:MAG TPA: phosphodiester glycosidase family protein, partial [Sedimentibacter sp.]|nr:phosphodiester glycosidase family protein [Sedimentibacter sp.]
MILKKIAAISAAAVLLLSSSAYAAGLYTVYDLSEEIRLSKSITYERIEKYTSSGWMNINVIRADLTDEYTEVKPINSEKGISNRATLSSMIKSSGAVAAVNGDFFYMGDPTHTY